MKTCTRCPENAVTGERYCKHCRKQVLSELREAGYLGPKPIARIGQGRTNEQRESTLETKFGRDG